MIRRIALASVLALSFGSVAASPVLAQAQAAVASPASHVELQAPDGRAIDVSVWAAADEQAVKAVIAVSTPGVVPGLVSPSTYATVAAPVLIVTGDADLVQGFVTDPRDHRAAFDTSPTGDKMLMTFAGGDHGFIGNADPADFELMAATTVDFMRAHALGDAAAQARLDALTAPEGVTIERR